MSHMSKVKVEMDNIKVVKTACDRLKIPYNMKETVKFFDGHTVTGFAIHFPGWQYPAVLVEQDGVTSIAMDTYNGHWGNEDHLKRLTQMYGVEVAKEKAYEEGYTVEEETLKSGEIRLTLQRF